MRQFALTGAKYIVQVVLAVLLIMMLLLGGAAPYGQDDPTSKPPTPTPLVLAEPRLC